MKKPTPTQVRVATYIAEVAHCCASDPSDSAAAYIQRVASEFNVDAALLRRAINGDAAALPRKAYLAMNRAIPE